MITKAEIEQFTITQLDLQKFRELKPEWYDFLLLIANERKRDELTKIALDLLPKEK